MVGRVLPAFCASAQEVAQHVGAVLEDVLAGEIGEGIQLDAKVPEQEGAGVRADGLHLGRVDDPAGNHVDLAGLERYGV